MRCLLIAIAFVGAAAGSVHAAEPAKKANEPMAGKMKKPGMKQGDVRKSAEKKKKQMKPMLDQESKSMQPGKK